MKRVICVLLGFFFLLTAAGAGFWLTQRFIESKEEQDSFNQLAENVLLSSPAPKATPTPQVTLASEPTPDIDPMAPAPTLEPIHDIPALQAMNPDCIGWITVPDTQIDYPVMWTPNDPEHYLRTAFDGEYSSYGVPFMDGRCSTDSDNMILYSHNKFDGTMFTSLIHYGDEDYFQNHRQIIFETAEGVRQYSIFAVCRADAYNSPIYQSIDFKSKNDFLNVVSEDSVLNVGPKESAKKFITLSTCDISRQNGRWVVVGEQVE